jgi:lipid-A-disaccharide synthase
VNEVANERKRIMLVVGEASGDLHGSRVVRALHEKAPTLEISAVAGEALRAEGVEVLFDVGRLTGMGFSELAGNLANLWRAYSLLKRELSERRPDLLILIDFPEFNLRLARIAKRLGVPVLYYISPQVWAWRKRRVAEIARSVDCMAVVFPFEVPLYEKAGLRVEFVGHPLLEIARPTRAREETLANLGLDPTKLTVAMLPGSRRREVAYHLPVMMEAAELLEQEMAVQFVLVRASTVPGDGMRQAPTQSSLRVSISDGDVYNVLHACDLAWTASGTATLETALMLRPMIIVYRLARLTYSLARLLVRVEHVGMANILAGERVVPELIQAEMTAHRIVRESRAILGDRGARERIVAKLAGVREKLGQPGAAGRVADLALELMRRGPA